jgi:hypothetical protein
MEKNNQSRDELFEERRLQGAAMRERRRKQMKEEFRERKRRGEWKMEGERFEGSGTFDEGILPFSSSHSIIAQSAFEFSFSQTQLLVPDQPSTSKSTSRTNVAFLALAGSSEQKMQALDQHPVRKVMLVETESYRREGEMSES